MVEPIGSFDGFASDGLAESIKRFTFPLRIRVILDMLGAPEDDLLFLKRWSEGWITHLTVQLIRPSRRPSQAGLIRSGSCLAPAGGA